MKILLMPLLLLAGAATLPAQALQWAGTTAALEVIEGGPAASGVFRFTNTSDQTVRVRSVPASCSCVSARAEPREVGPGEEGTIHFTYSPRGRWGTRAYRIMVATSEKGVPPYALRLEITETRRGQTAD